MSKKETYGQGYFDATHRLMGCLADNPSAEYLNGFLVATENILHQMECKRQCMTNMLTAGEREEKEILELIEYRHGEVLEHVRRQDWPLEVKIEYLSTDLNIQRKYAEKLI